MIVGVGVDVVAVERVRAALARHGARARRRLFTSSELSECDERFDVAECLAARLAAKEAALKAFGTGKAAGFRWTDLEVMRPDDGAPELRVAGKCRERAEGLGVTRIWVTLTHEAGIACAVVVMESN